MLNKSNINLENLTKQLERWVDDEYTGIDQT